MHLFATDAYTVHRLVYETYAGEDGRRFLYAPFVLTLHISMRVLVRPFDVATRLRRRAGVREARDLRLGVLDAERAGALPRTRGPGRSTKVGRRAKAAAAARRAWAVALCRGDARMPGPAERRAPSLFPGTLRRRAAGRRSRLRARADGGAEREERGQGRT